MEEVVGSIPTRSTNHYHSPARPALSLLGVLRRPFCLNEAGFNFFEVVGSRPLYFISSIRM